MATSPLLLLLVVLMLCLAHLCSSCVERERRALLSFKRSLIDPANRLSNWVGPNCCEWVGVKCNNNTAHVVKLHLENYGSDNYSLIGREVDPSLMELKHLESLSLSDNDFAGSEIPKFIGNFTKLRTLWLSGASFEGAVPASLGNLSNLEKLDLSGLRGLNLANNQLIGGIPTEIGNLRLLESLDFSNNLLTGAIPQSISELTFISYLDLSYNNLSGRIPTGHQLQTLEPWIYVGNPSLCGMQIEKLCAEDEPIRRNDVVNHVKDEGFEMTWFYIVMIIGFIVGFWGVWGVLFCKKAWRATYFQFVEDVHDLVLVKVEQLYRV